MTRWGVRATLRRHGRDDEGVAAVELAIVLPVFLAITLGAIDFALAFRQQIMLRNAASNAAAYAAVQPCDLGDSTSGINFQALAELEHVSVLKPDPTDVTVTTTFTDNSGSAVTSGDACTTASRVEVTVAAPYNLITGTFLGVFGVPQTMHVIGQETVQIQGRPV